jgi:AmiR/NasT family two-component response regulator
MDLPVVIVTGYPDSKLMHQATQFGPLMLITRPVDRIHLETVLQMARGEYAGMRGSTLRAKSNSEAKNGRSGSAGER